MISYKDKMAMNKKRWDKYKNLKLQHFKNNKCCHKNVYKFIDTMIENINVGKLPICLNCYNELIG